MIREAIGATMTIVGAIYLLWFILPQLLTAYTTVKSSSIVNATNPTTATIIDIGDSVFLMLGFLTVVVAFFIVILYFTRREPVDVRG